MTDERLLRKLSRRIFVERTAAIAVAHCAGGFANFSLGQSPKKTKLAYVGTYTGAIGAGSNGEGIYVFEMNVDTGALSGKRLVAKTASPSWIAIHPSRNYLFAVNEISDFHGNSGSVSAFAIDSASGDLSPLNTVSSEGAGPAYLSIDASGVFAFVANYAGGSIAVLPIGTNGMLGAAVDVHREDASMGSAHATGAPAGSFAISGHDAPHAHMILPDPSNKFVLATDLGQDRIYIYGFDQHTGKLSLRNASAFFSLPSGDGPRHFAGRQFPLCLQSPQ
jgi:6-phosphogluconolactonase